jgi:hypothetical protein
MEIQFFMKSRFVQPIGVLMHQRKHQVLMKRHSLILLSLLILALGATSCVSSRGAKGGCFATKGMVGY